MAENGGFDLSAILQNEETVQQLRQMAGSMGLSDKLEEVLSQQQTSGAASSAPRQAPSPPPSPPETGGQGKSGEPPGQLPLSPPASLRPRGRSRDGGGGAPRTPRYRPPCALRGGRGSEGTRPGAGARRRPAWGRRREHRESGATAIA